MKLSPFLNMYVDYCFQFTSGVQALDQARRKRPQLERYIAQAENQIRNANLVQRGPAAGGVVSLFDYLIKPVQRLCQYPLLFRQIAKEMELLAEPEGGAAAGQRKKSVRFELGEGGGGVGEAWPRGGIAKAKLVLQVLEDTVAGINDKARQQRATLTPTLPQPYPNPNPNPNPHPHPEQVRQQQVVARLRAELPERGAIGQLMHMLPGVHALLPAPRAAHETAAPGAGGSSTLLLEVAVSFLREHHDENGLLSARSSLPPQVLTAAAARLDALPRKRRHHGKLYIFSDLLVLAA